MTVQVRHWWRRRGRLCVICLVAAGGWSAGAGEAAGQPVPSEHVVGRFDVGWRPNARQFARTRVFTQLSEQGSFLTDYEIPSGFTIDGGVSALVWRNLAVGVDLSTFGAVHAARISAELPHPLFFDLPRVATGVAGGLERRDGAVHLRAIWKMRIASWVSLSLSGGPSVINVRQDLVSAVTHSEVGFPFDRIESLGHTVSRRSATTLGTNAAIEFETFVLHELPGLNGHPTLERLGLGVQVRYVWASATMQLDDDPLTVDLSGFQLTIGPRFRF
jgi:hypothetical protein